MKYSGLVSAMTYELLSTMATKLSNEDYALLLIEVSKIENAVEIMESLDKAGN
jgi:hypothetical protein